MPRKTDTVEEVLSDQRKVVVAVRELSKASKTFVERNCQRLFSVFRSAGGELVFGGDDRSVE